MKKDRGVSVVIAEVMMILIAIVVVIGLFVFFYFSAMSTPYNTDTIIGTLVFDNHSNSTHINFKVVISNPNRCSFDLVKILIYCNDTLYNLNMTSGGIYSYRDLSLRWRLEAKFSDNDADGNLSSGDNLSIRIVDEDYADGYTPLGFKDGDYVVLTIRGFNGSIKGHVNL